MEKEDKTEKQLSKEDKTVKQLLKDFVDEM